MLLGAELVAVSWARAGVAMPTVLLLLVKPAGSTSESSMLWLSSELESWMARLSMVVLLGVGESGIGVAVDTGVTCTTVFWEARLVCVTTVAVVTAVGCTSLEREAGIGASVWLLGVGVAEAEVSSGPGVMEAGVGGGAGAFLFLCWLSEPRPT